MDNKALIVYFTLFGIMKDTMMLNELKQYVSLTEKNDIPKEWKDNPYYFAKTSIDEIEGVKPSIIEVDPDK